MFTCAEVARSFELAAAEANTLLGVAVETLMEAVAVEAKELIGHESPKWPALAEATIAEKQRLGFTGQVSATDPLLRTGDLRESIKVEVEVSPYGATGVVGSESLIALWQELGTANAKHAIPPRPFLSTAMMECEPAAKLFGELATKLLIPRTGR
jgi:phage gpG-like protein